MISFFLTLLYSTFTYAGNTHHYVFFNLDRELIKDASFLENNAFEGAQLKYTWRELEPEENVYAFQNIKNDLDFLNQHGKKLFIQLQDVTFDSLLINVPLYLLQDEKYHGGADKQYLYEDNKEQDAIAEGWVARRWDPAVQERLHKLFFALGQEFDGKIEGINLAETAVSFGESGILFPKGFTFEIYRDAIITNMQALKAALPKSVALQYANFMPGEWRPWDDRSYLATVYQKAQEFNIGVGGPDLLPYKKGQMNHCYHFLRECAGLVPTGIAVQWDNYKYINPKTEKEITIQELIEFAKDYLKVDYIFWCTQEPYYSQQLIPYLKTIH